MLLCSLPPIICPFIAAQSWTLGPQQLHSIPFPLQNRFGFLVLSSGEKGVSDGSWKKRDKGIINLDTLSNTVFCHSRRWQLHLLPSWRKSERQSGSSGEPCGLFPELCPLYDLLVSHVWFPCRHTKGQAALPETRRVWPAGLEGHWTPRRPLAGRACPAPQVSETLPGKFPSVGRAAASGTWG